MAPSHSQAPKQNGYYWERSRRTALPVIVGALGLAGLGVGQLLPVRNSAESNLTARSADALADAGIVGVTVDFTGQDGVLTGSVASAADVDRALEVVRGLDGVRVATARLTVPGAAPAATATPAPATTPTPGTTASETPDLTATATPDLTASVTPTPSVTPTLTATATPPAPTPAATPTPAPTATSSVAGTQAQLRALPPVGFAYASARLTPSGQAVVKQAAAILLAAPALKVRIEGYTDDVGDWDVNLVVSRTRAEAVRAALIANGVPAARVTSLGLSEERPKVPNTSEANRAINRRVEFVLS